MFKVTIEFNDKVNGEGIQRIIEDYFYEENIVSNENNEVIVMWPVSEDEDSYEIENEMFYILDGGQKGYYSCELVN